MSILTCGAGPHARCRSCLAISPRMGRPVKTFQMSRSTLKEGRLQSRIGEGRNRSHACRLRDDRAGNGSVRCVRFGGPLCPVYNELVAAAVVIITGLNLRNVAIGGAAMRKAGTEIRNGGGVRGNVIELSTRRAAAEMAIEYRSFGKSLGKALAKSRGEKAPGEPNFYFSSSPNAKPFALRYARERLGYGVTIPGDARVLFWEAPVPRSGSGDGLTRVANNLLETVGDPLAEKHRTADEKMRQLGEYLSEHGIAFMILADLHHLVTPGKRLARRRLFRQIFSIIKTLVRPSHVLFIGDREILEELLFQDQWVRQRCVELRWDVIGSVAGTGSLY